VQVIKKGAKAGGILQFGTEVVAAGDGSLACLLGASPGASTAVSIMLEILERCFSEELASDPWQARLREMIPSFGQSLIEDAGLFRRVQLRSTELLDLWDDEKPAARRPRAISGEPTGPLDAPAPQTEPLSSAERRKKGVPSWASRRGQFQMKTRGMQASHQRD
jgi:hypothetical protein